jgi:hypothetical protein
MRIHARKRRTRQHIIADLSVNHVERIVLRSGNTVERIQHDYGIDLLMYTYDSNGEYENGDVRLQVRATERLEESPRQAAISWRVETAHLRHWLNEPMPVFLIVYDANRERAYWSYVQRYFEARRRKIPGRQRTVSLDIPADNVLTEEAVREFARFRDAVLSQARGIIRHHE